MADTTEDTGDYVSNQDEETKKRLADTNMENYGGKEHRDKQKAIADKMPEWFNAGEKVGQEVWRIEKFKVVRQPKETYGHFYNGDSYIVLNTYKPDASKEMLAYNVHFWLGKDTSQDEAGAAAIKTVELDDKLGDLPVQYREVQGHESKFFLDLWDSMEILEGGVDSGFREVKPEEYRPRLLHIAGKPKKMKIDEVPLGLESLNNCDAFVLDNGREVYQFRPPHASAWEKQASNKYVNDLVSSRHGKVTKKCIVNLGDTNADAREFWEIIGCEQPAELPETPAREAAQAELEEKFNTHVNKMFHVTDDNADNKMTISEVQSGVLCRDILQEENDDVLIIDVGRVIFVWIGRDANKNELRTAMAHAEEYKLENGRPNWLPVQRVIDQHEPAHFWKCFDCEKVPKSII